MENDHNIKKVVNFHHTVEYDIAMEVKDKDNIYSRKELTEILSKESKLSNSGLYKRIDKMIARGELSRVGSGQYSFKHKHSFDYSVMNDISKSILEKLEKRFDKSSRYILYESSLLNVFLNHLIGRSTIILEVEKELVETIFWFLKEEGFNNVLLNPSENDNYIYNPYDGSGIIVKTMVSKAPIDNKHHKITIEKLIVDIVCDKTLNMFYEDSEIPHMVEDIVGNYNLKYDSIKNYAKRRHSLDKFLNCIPEGFKEAFYD